MRYTAERPTAMILPLPVALPAKEDSVRFKSLKEYPGFFTDLAAGFPALPSSGLMRSKSAPESQAVAAAAPLAVHDVGDFVATFVPSVKDFGRVDARFVIPKDVWDRVPAYADYGFAVFQQGALGFAAPHDAKRSQAVVDGNLLVHKKTLRGLLPNRDTTFDLRAVVASRSSGACSRCDVGAGAAPSGA